MPVEYLSLSLLTFFLLLAWVPVSVGKGMSFGVKWLASNRSTMPAQELPKWASRCERAYNNLKDNFPAFAVAILMLGSLGKFDQGTTLASLIFLAARFCHYLAYAAGVFLPRFLSFFIGLLATFYLLVKVLI